MPDWGFTAGDEIQFAYGSHRWEVDTKCCGTDNLGYCASTEFHSKVMRILLDRDPFSLVASAGCGATKRARQAPRRVQ